MCRDVGAQHVEVGAKRGRRVRFLQRTRGPVGELGPVVRIEQIGRYRGENPVRVGSPADAEAAGGECQRRLDESAVVAGDRLMRV